MDAAVPGRLTAPIMGDSACWLSVTCDGCGSVLERDRTEVDVCPFCGTDPNGDTEPATYAMSRDAADLAPTTPGAGRGQALPASSQSQSGGALRE